MDQAVRVAHADKNILVVGVVMDELARKGVEPGPDGLFVRFAETHDQVAPAGVGDQAGVPSHDVRSVVHVPDEVRLLFLVGEAGEGVGQPSEEGAEVLQQAGTVRPGVAEGPSVDVGQHSYQVMASVVSIDPGDGFAVPCAAYSRPGGFFVVRGQVFQGGMLKVEDAAPLARAGDLEDEHLAVAGRHPEVLIALARQRVQRTGNAVQGKGEFTGLFRTETGPVLGDGGQRGPATGHSHRRCSRASRGDSPPYVRNHRRARSGWRISRATPGRR